MQYALDPIAAEALLFLEDICARHRLSFDESVGVPLLAEGTRVETMWRTLQEASTRSQKRQLYILFINQRETETSENTELNYKTLDFFSMPHDMRFSLNPLGRDFLFVINGTQASFFLKKNEGVGRARKVPADLALGLFHKGFLKSEFHRQTDADVSIPLDYFLTELKASEVAATYPYAHTQGELNADEYAALLHYEKWLASYCEGLEYAGSPYCYWALGSTLFFRLSAYEKIRGFPNVRAGEDFHFLSKLRKQGLITRLKEPVLEIRGRHSDRVPFGTGKALENMKENKKTYALYPKQIFEDLKRVLMALNALAEHKELEKFFSDLDSKSQEFFKSHSEVFGKILSQGSPVEQKRKLLNESFDALATLRWINSRL